MSVAEFTDNDLRMAVAAYCRDLCADDTVYDPGHIFSAFYNERIQRVLAISRRQIRRRRTLRMVASVYIVLMLAFGTVMAFNEPVRAAVINWTVNIYNKLVDITFNHVEDDHAYVICSPGELPEGFEQTEKYHSGYYTRYVYKNAEGRFIKFEYRKPTEAQKQKIEKRGASSEIITSSMGVQMFLSEGNGKCDLFWYDADLDLAYYVESNLDKDTLVQCFDVVQMSLPLYEPTWLPDGYKETERADDYPYYWIMYSGNEGNDGIIFSYTDMAESDLISIWKGETDIDYKTVKVGDNKALLFLPNAFDPGTDLILVDESRNLVYEISGSLTEEEIIAVAESIICKEP